MREAPRVLAMRCAGVLVCAVVLHGCSGSAAPRDTEGGPPRWLEGGTGVSLRLGETGSVAERTVDVTPSKAWRVLGEVYEALGLGGAVLQAESLTWANPEVVARRVAGVRTDRLFRCGNEGAGPSAVNRFRVEFSIATEVSEADDGRALLLTRVEARGSPWEGTSTTPVVCVSRGLLEQAIERGVLERVTGAGLPG